MTLDQIDATASLKTPTVAGIKPSYGTLLNGGTSSDEDILVIECGSCSAKNLVLLGKDAWYAVFCGIGVGVQNDLACSFPLNIWPSTEFKQDTIYYLTKGIRGAHYKKYKMREMAEDVLNNARARGLVQYLKC